MVPLASYVTPELKAHHHAAFGDDYSASCMWYVRGIENLGIDEELRALKAGEIKQSLNIKTLMVTGLKGKLGFSPLLCFPSMPMTLLLFRQGYFHIIKYETHY